MKLSSFRPRQWFKFTAILIAVILAVGILFPDTVHYVLAETTDRAPVHFALRGIRSQERMQVELRDPSSSVGNFSAVTNTAVLTAIVTGGNSNFEEFFYTWGVRKRDKDKNIVPLSSGDLPFAENATDNEKEFNQKVQAFAAIGNNCKYPNCLPLQDEKYGDLVLVKREGLTFQQTEKYIKNPSGDPDDLDDIEWREKHTDGTYTVQYFDRLKKDASGKYTISMYDQWAKDQGIASEKPTDDHDNDGFDVSKIFGGAEGRYGISYSNSVASDDYFKTLRTDWARAMCGDIENKTFTVRKDDAGKCSILNDSAKIEQGRVYCHGNTATKSFFTKLFDPTPWINDKLTQRNQAGRSDDVPDHISPLTTEGLANYCTQLENKDTRAFTLHTCGVSSEFLRYWEDSWKSYRDGDDIENDRDADDALDDCYNMAAGSYDNNRDHINLTNCFSYDTRNGTEVQTACYHKTPAVNSVKSNTITTVGTDAKLTNYAEFVFGTDPNNKDSDGDGKADGADLVGYGQSRLDIPIDQITAIPTLDKDLQAKLNTHKHNTSSTVGQSDGSTYEFSVNVEGLSSVVQRMADPTDKTRTVEAPRIYHQTATKKISLDFRSQVSVGSSLFPTFPNIRQALKFVLSPSIGDLGVSPGNFYFKWYLVKDGKRVAEPVQEGLGESGFNEFSIKPQMTGEINVSADVFMQDPDTGALYFIKTVDRTVVANPGLEVVANSETRCYRQGEVAKLTARTQKRNGPLFFSWFVDNQVAENASGFRFDPEDPRFKDIGAESADIDLDQEVLSLPITKEAPATYNVKLAYDVAGAASSNPNPAISEITLYVCDPQKGTLVNIDNASDQFGYRPGIKVTNHARALAKPGVKAELSGKLDPLLATAKNLSYEWTVLKNDKPVQGVSGARTPKITIPLAGDAGADTYLAKMKILDPSNPDTVIESTLEIALTDQSPSEVVKATTGSRNSISQLINNLANFRTLTLGRAVDTLFRLGLILAALSAIGVLIWGGNGYIVGAAIGSVGAVKSSQDRITSAILGLVIAFTSWMLLNFINPDLLEIREPALQNPVSQTKPAPIPPGNSKTPTKNGSLSLGTACTTHPLCATNLSCAPAVTFGTGNTITPDITKRTCQKACSNTTDCGTGQRCVPYTKAGTSAPAGGKSGFCASTTAPKASTVPKPTASQPAAPAATSS